MARSIAGCAIFLIASRVRRRRIGLALQAFELREDCHRPFALVCLNQVPGPPTIGAYPSRTLQVIVEGLRVQDWHYYHFG
jgi:hypothetical protein